MNLEYCGLSKINSGWIFLKGVPESIQAKPSGTEERKHLQRPKKESEPMQEDIEGSIRKLQTEKIKV